MFKNFGSTLFLGTLISLCFSVWSCQKETDPINPDDEKKDSSKQIVGIGLKLDSTLPYNASDITIILNDTITILLPPNTDVTKLTPTFSIKGFAINPESGTVQNFTNPVTYTVTAEDGTKRTYVVRVIKRLVRKLYTGNNDGYFYCINATNGAKRWQYKANFGFAYSQPLIWEGIVYAGNQDGQMYAFDAMTGSIKWKFMTSNRGIESYPVTDGTSLYFGSNDGYIYAVDLNTGDLKWKFLTGINHNVSAGTLVHNGVVFAANGFGNLYAINAQTGNLKWTFHDTSNYSRFNQSKPVIENGTLYIGAGSGNLFALNENTGAMRWSFNDDNISLEMSTPLVKNDTIFITGQHEFGNTSNTGSLYCVDAKSGKLIWKALDKIGFNQGVAGMGNRIYASGNNLKFYALGKANGNILWEKSLPATSFLATSMQSDIFFSDLTGLSRVDGNNGNTKWFFPGYVVHYSKPTVTDDFGNIYK
jgi:outer membrane protein assembly factor BamB